MKKRKFKLCLIILICTAFITMVACNKSKDSVEDFPEIVNKLDSYKLSGTLESVFPSGNKVSNVTVYYQKPDLYRVELVLPNSLEKQVILKNTDGVFVLIPSLNKTFKVSSDWPLTSSYPYLLQSLSKDILADEELTKETKDNKTIYRLNARLFDNAQKTHQKITFNNETNMPEEIAIYKDDETLITHFKIDNIETNISIDNKMFKNNETMDTLKEVIADVELEFDRTQTYPTYCPVGVTLKDEIITGSGDNKRILLTYAGESFITIVETFVTPYENLKTEYVDGDIYVLGGVAAVVNDSTITFYEAGIEYSLASSNLEKIELAWVADSLRNMNEK